MTSLAVAAVGLCLLLGAFLPGYIWVRTIAPGLAVADHIALSMGASTVVFGVIGFVAYAAPWSFRFVATIGVAVYLGGAVLVAARRVTDWGLVLRRNWVLWLPFVLSYCFVVGFGQVQGDPDATVSFRGTFYSAHVAKLPADHYLPFRTAQVAEHRIPLDVPLIFDWDFSDRTPLAGFVAAAAASAAGIDFGVQRPWDLPEAEQAPQPRDPVGFWYWRLVGALLNASVVLGIARFALSLFDRRTALVAGLLAALSPYVLTHENYLWPKMLAAYFLLLHFTYVRERRLPVVAGACAALAYLAHPLSALFLIGSMFVLLKRRSFAALATAAALVLPWQIWMSIVSHPSRMITYPLGMTVMDENHFSSEIRRGFRYFWDSGGIPHALRIRGEIILHSLVPVDINATCAECTSNSSSWFAAHDRVLSAIVLLVLVPAVGFGLRRWLRRTPSEVWWMLVVPFAACVAFWGITNVALGADVLQPMGALLIAVSAGGLVSFSRRWRVAFGALAVIEAASVVWWGLFAPLDGVSTLAVSLVVLTWVGVAAGLLVALAHGTPSLEHPHADDIDLGTDRVVAADGTRDASLRV